MSTELTVIEQALVQGNIAQLNPTQRVAYVARLCETMGLNPLTKPFEYVSLNGKLTLYATKGCAEQLRHVHKVSIVITDRKVIEGVYVVTAKARDATGREDESTGAVPVGGLKGEQLANAYMKAETKAKRRVTFSLLGLNMLDETEAATIPGAMPVTDSTQPQGKGDVAFVGADLPSDRAPAQPQSSAPPTEGKRWSPSEKQLNRLFAITHASGYSTPDAKRLMKERYKAESSKDLTRQQYDDLCTYIENHPKHDGNEDLISLDADE